MSGAELAARITAASAARADFERQRRAFARGDGPRPEWADWAVRLSATVGQLVAWLADPASRPAGSTGVGPDGWAAVAPADLGVVVGALYDAAACHDGHGGDRAAAAGGTPQTRRGARRGGDLGLTCPRAPGRGCSPSVRPAVVPGRGDVPAAALPGHGQPGRCVDVAGAAVGGLVALGPAIVTAVTQGRARRPSRGPGGRSRRGRAAAAVERLIGAANAMRKLFRHWRTRSRPAASSTSTTARFSARRPMKPLTSSIRPRPRYGSTAATAPAISPAP